MMSPHVRILPAFVAGVIVALFGWTVAGPPVPAAQAQQPQQQEETIPSAEVSDPELEQFTRSILQVQAIQMELEGALAGAQDPAQAQQLQQQANARMVAVIEDEGLEVARYNLIARSVSADPELAQRLQTKRAEIEEEEAQ